VSLRLARGATSGVDPPRGFGPRDPALLGGVWGGGGGGGRVPRDGSCWIALELVGSLLRSDRCGLSWLAGSVEPALECSRGKLHLLRI
jgi:hypothetical protein